MPLPLIDLAVFLAGDVVGVLVILWMSMSPLLFTQGHWVAFRSPFPANFTIIIGTAVIFLVGFLLARRRMAE